MILIIRLPTFSLTHTPPPRYKNSKWRIDHCKRNVLKHIGINFSKMSGTCIDNMFSGHAAHIIVPLTIILLHSKNTLEKISLTLLSFISILSIITGRLHYSSDVIVSTVVSALTVFFIDKNLK